MRSSRWLWSMSAFWKSSGSEESGVLVSRFSPWPCARSEPVSSKQKGYTSYTARTLLSSAATPNLVTYLLYSLTCVSSSPKPSQNSLSVTTPSQSLSISRISRAATGSARRSRSTLVRVLRVRDRG